MATALEPGTNVSATRRSASFGLPDNLRRARGLLLHRRSDLRFRVLPLDGLQLLNAAVAVATLLLIVAFVFDPLLVPWQAALPEEIVRLFKHVTRFGKSDWILIGTGVFALLMLVSNAGALRARLRARRAIRTLAATYVFVAVASSGIIANLAKYVIGRARPAHFADTGSVSFDFMSGDSSWASFPSGHATTAMALGVSLALLFPRLRYVCLALGFWIAVSRLFLAVHYPSDVVAGGLLGASTAWLLARALARRRLIFTFDESGGLVRRQAASGRLF